MEKQIRLLGAHWRSWSCFFLCCCLLLLLLVVVVVVAVVKMGKVWILSTFEPRYKPPFMWEEGRWSLLGSPSWHCACISRGIRPCEMKDWLFFTTVHLLLYLFFFLNSCCFLFFLGSTWQAMGISWAKCCVRNTLWYFWVKPITVA